MIDLDDPRTALVLALADDDLVMGHRALHWIGFAPSLEEDIAFAGVAQDEINHADVWYQLLVGGEREAVDALGLGRQPHEYRHAVLCEHEPHDFAYTLARHWLYDHADSVRLTALADSTDADVAAIAAKLLHEERYHVEHADTWFERMTSMPGEPRERLAAALRATFREALDLFEPTVGEDELVASGVLPLASRDLMTRWLDVVGARLDELDVPRGLPDDLHTSPGGRRGEHTDAWREAWDEMTALYRAHPGARW